MQMLISIFGPEGARYASFVLTAIVLLILMLIVWWLIRKAMGGRLNMSEKPDRRGRPPRLGITESFTVDRQGRRLVMVRRDNVEHLVMIGGPNDVVIETNVIRGERVSMNRPEMRIGESEMTAAASVEIAPAQPTQPLVMAAPLSAIKPLETLKPSDQVAVQAPPVQAPAPFVAAKPVEPVKPLDPIKPPEAIKSPEPIKPAEAAKPPEAPEAPANAKPLDPFKAVFQAPAAAPLTQAAKTVAEALPEVSLAPQPQIAVPVEKPKSGMSFAERIKSALPIGGQGASAAKDAVKTPALPKEPASEKPAVAVKPAETKPDAEKTVPQPATPKPETPVDAPVAKRNLIDELKATLDKTVKPSSAPPASSVPAPTMPPPPVATVTPVPAAAPPAAAPPAAPSPAPAKVASKNPFDSLEEEMAKLLGRAPDGKG